MTKKRLLIVDDHEVVRLGLRSMLENYPDFEVVAEAGNAKEAIQQVGLQNPDIVLMDIRLPGTSGIEATKKLLASIQKQKLLC